MRLPLISIIITTYNYAHYVGDAIRSALGQDYPNLEVLVVDNASSDATEPLVATFSSDRRLRYHRHPENIGMVPNHNAALEMARGEYIAFLSADDFMLPGFISRSYEYLSTHPDIDVRYAGAYLTDAGGNFSGVRQMPGQPVFAYDGGRNELASLLSMGCYMCFPTMLMRRDLYTRFGLLDDTIQAADFEIVIRWAGQGVRFAYDPEPVIGVRLHSEQLSGIQNNFATGLDVREQIYLVRKYVSPENEPRIAGYEKRIAQHIAGAFTYGAKHNAQLADDAELVADVRNAMDYLTGVKERNRERPRKSRPTIVILAGKYITPLEETLRSLVAQTFEDWEALVVQLPGHSWAPLARQCDPRGRIKTLQLITIGHDGARLNQALRIAGGNVLAFMHAGTVWPAQHLETLAATFERDGVEITAARAAIAIDQLQGEMPNRRRLDLWRDLHGWPDMSMLRVASVVPLDTLAFRMEMYDQIGPFHEQLPVFEDWEIALRLQNATPITPLDSEVEIRTMLTWPDRDIPFGALLAAAQALYAAWPGPDDETEVELRREMLVDLELLSANHPKASRSPSALPDFYRVAAGTRLRQRAVRT
ncbi:MAG TPA: glycosyltransferase [Candidatus Baltobacteraceae bacterium]|jgi:glycosyltransferase involved in cell wall biosynthesis